ncbi:MAG TPA: F0F1 ATP synthase subunit gamma [Alphaproteobacteria bacterium]|nr:F0F1 ATP synthase subunit gamma [Alphaproteobacteria bacterium]
MPSLKDLRVRIGSVKSTQKITRAMQMVAASKLRRAQESVEAARPYSARMERMLASLGSNLSGTEGASPLLVGTGKSETYLLVVATGERGLCGAFNSSIARAARQKITALKGEGKTVKILCVGRKGRDALKRQYGDLIIDTIELRGLKSVTFADAQPIAVRVLDMFAAGEFDVCSLFYNRFKSVMTQIVTERQLIPAALPKTGETEPGPDLGGAIYEYEPAEEEILAELLPRNIVVQVFQALLENAASEQGSRMTAMDSATRNAGDMIDQLTLNYNRTRQAVITKELIEIISGAEAL